jgi:hypothetical protein
MSNLESRRMLPTVARLAALAAALGIGQCAVAAPVAGTYVLASGARASTGQFEISGVSDTQGTLSLHLTHGSPRPRDTCCVRTGSLDKEVVRISGNVALYQGPREEANPCQLVFVFSRDGADVAQFGECGAFGVGVSAGGHYTRRASRK